MCGCTSEIINIRQAPHLACKGFQTRVQNFLRTKTRQLIAPPPKSFTIFFVDFNIVNISLKKSQTPKRKIDIRLRYKVESQGDGGGACVRVTAQPRTKNKNNNKNFRPCSHLQSLLRKSLRLCPCPWPPWVMLHKQGHFCLCHSAQGNQSLLLIVQSQMLSPM